MVRRAPRVADTPATKASTATRPSEEPRTTSRRKPPAPSRCQASGRPVGLGCTAASADSIAVSVRPTGPECKVILFDTRVRFRDDPPRDPAHPRRRSREPGRAERAGVVPPDDPDLRDLLLHPDRPDAQAPEEDPADAHAAEERGRRDHQRRDLRPD